jgi:hypothetical protein
MDYMNRILWTTSTLVLGGVLVAASPATAATCSVPNVIANGQVADASRVMDNFTAVAGCAEQRVTATGTPVTGSVSVFSGANSITAGNLTGDVTTSGGTATTLSSTGVTPGIYSNPNIVVDAKGRITSASVGSGGTGGSSWGFSPPSATHFTLNSATSTNLVLVDDADAGLLVDGGLPQSGFYTRIAYENLNNKSSAWDLKARIQSLVPTTNNSGCGLVIRDSISGRLTTLGFWQDGYIYISNFDSSSSLSGTMAGFATESRPNWLRISHDGANYTFYASVNGKAWTSIATFSDTSWLTGKGDQVGLFVSYNRTTESNTSMSVSFYELSQ